MKLGIHHRVGSFSTRWIEYCELHSIPYKVVNAYASDIIHQLSDCDGFMWQWCHDDYRDQLIARSLTKALEATGKKVFPDSKTAWHFDDKIAQKYLFEAIGAPTAPAYVFYEKETALAWAKHTSYPKVFKLKGGAGSLNVRLVRSFPQMKRLIHKAFGSGFRLVDRMSSLKDSIWMLKRDRTIKAAARIVSRALKMIAPPASESLLVPQKGYLYCQDFIPKNAFDDRLVVIGNRCFCARRFCRQDDFRASGSGLRNYDHKIFPKESLKIAYDLAKKLGSQSLACDFVYDHQNNPLVVEISYGFSSGPYYDSCDGYFDSDLNWHDVKINPAFFMIEDFVATLRGLLQNVKIKDL